MSSLTGHSPTYNILQDIEIRLWHAVHSSANLWVQDGGASPSTLRTFAPALVYAPAEYCAPAWSRNRHTSLLDVSLNCTLRIITGCLQSTPVEQLSVLAGIPPAELRRRAASLALASRAMDSDHLLYHTITREETKPRLKSQRQAGKTSCQLPYPMRPRPIG